MKSAHEQIMQMRTENIDQYQRVNLFKGEERRKMELTHKKTGKKYMAYAYRLKKDFNKIKHQLQRQISQFISLQDKQLACLEDVFLTTIGNKQKKKEYIVFLRKLRLTSATLAQIGTSPQRKAQINILNIAQKVASTMAILQKKRIAHNNLSAETVQYCNDNVIIDLPMFEVVSKYLKSDLKTDQKESQHEKKLSKDLSGYFEILLKLSVGQKFKKKKKICLWEQSTVQLLNQITDNKIKQLLISIIVEKKIPLQQVTFEIICIFLQTGNFPSLSKAEQMKVESLISRSNTNEIIDILQLPMIGSFQKSSVITQKYNIKGDPVFRKEIQFNMFDLVISCYEECLMFDLTSKLNPNLRKIVVISNKRPVFPFKKYFFNAKQFVQSILHKNIGSITLQQSGYLSCNVPLRYAEQLQSKLRLVNNQKRTESNLFPECCVGFIRDGATYTGRCFLLNATTFVTAASSFYDRKKKIKRNNLVFSVVVCRGDCKQFRYPPQYETCSEQDAWKYNYAIGKLQKLQVRSSYLPNLIYNYNEKQLNQQVRKEQTILEYLINSNKIPLTSLELQNGIIQGLKASDQIGSPVFVCVNNRQAVFGIKTHKNKGFSFNDEHVGNMYKWMQEMKIDKHKICYSQIYEAKYFNYHERDTLVFSQAFSDCMRRFKNPNMNILINNLIGQNQYFELIAALQTLAIRPHLNSKHRINYYKLLLKMYEDHYHSKHWRIPYLLIEYANALRSRAQYEEAKKNIISAVQIETKDGRNNPMLLGELHFDLGNTYQSLGELNQAQKCYQESIKQFEKVYSYDEIGRCHHNLAQIYKEEEKPELSCLSYQKAIQIKQRYSEKDDFISTLFTFFEFAKEKKLIEKAIIIAKKTVEISKKVMSNKNHWDIRLENMWKSLQLITEVSNLSSEVMQAYQMLQKVFGPIKFQ